ncbi:MAG: S26 family signal peptidase [Kiritimatiellae bacterium]|nr:S26 family signal peptidase [Kiritimatiellia bacterium]
MKSFTDYGREWLDTLVVAISVAMAFRAYFYEPFKIPTGSMQETLWGYHTAAGTEKGMWDEFPLSWLKLAWTGSRTVDWKAPATGTVRCTPRQDGFATVQIGTHPKTWSLPTDACRELHGRFVRAGETLWKGAITTGDFIFVNRWKWNFVQPQNGEVMIFSTTGIDKLPQGTHYIKRMKARPGETYVLEHPVQGRPTEVTMGKDEYFACGDNFANSFDSRYWGTVPRENLRGLGSVVFWPFNGWRIIR